MKFWWRIWFFILALKLVLGAWLPLTPDEAYYWVWGQNLQLSYYDHPPMVAWLMRLGEYLPDWAIRFPAIILAHFMLFFWRDLLAKYLSAHGQIIFLILASLMPLVGPGSLIVTPDLPLMFSWSFALWSFQRLLNSNGEKREAVLLGLALGLGILSKYHIVLIGPVFLGWWWTVKPSFGWRRWLPLTIVTLLVVATPVWLWNIQNNFASIRFQLSHGLGRPSWKPSWTWEYVAVQIAFLFPTILWLANKPALPKHLRWAAFFPLAFFFFTSFRGYVEANWPIVAHPAVLALAVVAARSWTKTLVLPLVIWTLGFSLILTLCALPNWPDWVGKTKISELRKYDRLDQVSRNLILVYAPSYQLASILSYRQKRVVAKLNGMNRRDFFDSLESSKPHSDFNLVMRKTDQVPAAWSTWRRNKIIPVDENFEIWEMVVR